MVSIAVFILGLCVGSFLNVLIDRLPKSESVLLGRSYCDHCKHKLSFADLIPVFSFILLNRQCRYCGKKISWQYPIVELVTGILFLYSYSSTGVPLSPFYFPEIIFLLITISGLIVIFFTDLKYRIIPDQILITMVLTTGIFLLFLNGNKFADHLTAAAIFFLIFLLLVIVTRGRGIGLGDVKYAAVSGFILGLPYSVVSFYLSFLTGAGLSLILILWGKKTMKSTIPFGPFLVLGTFISLFYGEQLWGVFRRIIGL